MTASTLLGVLFAASAASAVGAHAAGNRRLVYVFKPLATALLLLLVVVGSSPASSRYAAAVFSGLLFSLLGDVFLMLPSDHFRSGLASFLAAHGCYVFAFVSDSPFAAPLLPFVLCLLVAGVVLPFLWPGVPRRLRPPVLVYVVLLLVMAGQAASRAAHLPAVPALCAAAGAALFVASDALLAWNRFRRPIPAAQVLIHATYFPAQWLIAVSALSAWANG